MKKLILILTLFISISINGQSRSLSEWDAMFQNEISGNFSHLRWTGLSETVAGPYKSYDISDMYWEAFAILNGYIHAWLATGNNNYLDFVLDVIEQHIDGAVYMNTANPPPQLATYRTWNFKANLAKPNFFGFNGTISIPTYMNQADPAINGYGRRTNANGTSAGTIIPLDEGMYYRNVANVCRIIHNNISTIGAIESNNGQTYQERLDYTVAYVRDHIWARNFENPNIDNNHWGRDVYRVNTHMSSHLAMVALCLHVIEGDQKYLDFLNEFLYDFDNVPNGFKQPSYLTPGQGFLDKLILEPEGWYTWYAPWDRTSGNQQDAGHAVAEYQILEACYQEGYGLNPPDGEPTIDLLMMQRLAKGIQFDLIDNYVCADGSNEPAADFRFNSESGISYGFQSALTVFGQYNPDVQCWTEQRLGGIDLQQIGTLGAAMYVSAVLGVNNSPAPAFTPNGQGGAGVSNFSPVVNPRAGFVVNALIGDPFVDLGADVSDVEDGNSFIPTATSGSVPVDGSNNYSTAGSFILRYTTTDAGGASGTASTTYNISSVSADPPVLTLDASSQIIDVNGTYTPTTYSWTDPVDGGPFTTGAVLSGDTVDTGTPGVYNVIYTVTNAAGLQASAVEVITIENNYVPVTGIVINEPNLKYRMALNDTNFFTYTIYPLDATNRELEVEISDGSIIESQPTDAFTYQMLALKKGTTTMTLRTVDGGFEQTIEVIVNNPGSILSVIINQ